MKAVVYRKYGPPEVLALREVDKPTPRDDELLVKVHSTTVTPGDYRMRQANPWMARLFNGLRRPKRVTVLGFEVAGEVEAVGAKVSLFKPGDQVFGANGLGFGGYAEYICLPEMGTGRIPPLVAIKPADVSFADIVPLSIGGTAALNVLKLGNLSAGMSVLINGASGSVGTYAIQIAKHLGAEVTGVCSAANHELVTSLGADRVIDYTKQDVTALKTPYDLVFDAVGKLVSKISKSKFKRILSPGGAYVSVEMYRKDSADDLVHLGDLMAAGHLRTVVDRRYGLEEIAEAHRYVEQGHKKGNVIITVQRKDAS